MTDRAEDIDVGANAAARRGPTRRFEARRHDIIRSAIAELNRKGVRGMTLGEVAARLDLVPTGVIYYFRNKEELAQAALLQGLEAFDRLVAAGDAEPDERRRVSAFVGAYFDLKQRVALGQADEVPVFNDIRALNCERVNAAFVELFRHVRTLLAPADRLPRPHANARAHLLLSNLLWTPAWLRRVELADYPRTAERTSDILLNGLLGPSVAWTAPKPLSLQREGDPSAHASSELFLRAATELINEQGYHGASVERISARLNVSKGAFYHHNATKDELVAACFQRTFDIVWRAIHEAEAAGGSGLEVLVNLAAALIERQVSGGAPLLRTSALTTVPEAIRAGLLETFDQLSYRFASIICEGVGDGSIRPLDVNIAAQTLTAAINAAAELRHWAPGVGPEAVTELYVRPLFEGLASPAA
ncbi:TetR family transcriptional regulator [Phenylobacterium sp.]|uniref:TetR/AcrR family transcriptional regulator n=1 Tax=Phenylobacterium sp. TaxID=1871053 RepID=UPI0028124FDC|nr:TetR family transcriptional regulator [Phenylobacterium sp.]